MSDENVKSCLNKRLDEVGDTGKTRTWDATTFASGRSDIRQKGLM